MYRLLASRNATSRQSKNVKISHEEALTREIRPPGDVDPVRKESSVRPRVDVENFVIEHEPSYIRGGGTRPRTRHRLKTRYDMPEAVMCPHCGRLSEPTHASASEMSADLQIIWLECAPDNPEGRAEARAHCRGCQPHAVYAVDCDEVFCEAGPFLGGMLAEQADVSRSVPPAAKDWLRNQGWTFESWTMRCPEHPIRYGMHSDPSATSR